jgi:predicted nuclease with TOPRIM domain
MSEEPCRKVSFADEKAAINYINILQNTSKRKRKPVRAYLCEKCLTWHLTSKKEILSPEDEQLTKRIGKLENKVKQLTKESENKTKKIDKLHEEVYDLNRRLGRTSNKNTDYDWETAKSYVIDLSQSWQKRFKALESHHIKEMEIANKNKNQYEN